MLPTVIQNLLSNLYHILNICSFYVLNNAVNIVNRYNVTHINVFRVLKLVYDIKKLIIVTSLNSVHMRFYVLFAP